MPTSHDADSGEEFDVRATGSDTSGWCLTITGELDVRSAQGLTAILNSELADGHHILTLDLGGLTFCDATGLAVFVDCNHRFAAAGGQLKLIEVNAALWRLLRLTGLNKSLSIERIVEDRGLRQPPAAF